MMLCKTIWFRYSVIFVLVFLMVTLMTCCDDIDPLMTLFSSDTLMFIPRVLFHWWYSTSIDEQCSGDPNYDDDDGHYCWYWLMVTDDDQTIIIDDIIVDHLAPLMMLIPLLTRWCCFCDECYYSGIDDFDLLPVLLMEVFSDDDIISVMWYPVTTTCWLFQADIWYYWWQYSMTGDDDRLWCRQWWCVDSVESDWYSHWW